MWQYEIKTWAIIDINYYNNFFSKDRKNSEDQYWIFMNKLKSRAPSKNTKTGKR